jgi:beta-glucosidase
MADWGGTVSVAAATAGLDQQSGEQLDHQVWFDAPLREAVAAGEVAAERVADMARRVLRSMFVAGLFDRPARTGEPIGVAAHAAIARKAAERGIVLLKNDRELLPVRESARRIVVVGGRADVGVLCGGGSSQVTTGKGHAAFVHVGGEGAMMAMASEAFHPSPPLKAIKARARGAEVRFINGRYVSEAVRAAENADLVVVFATQWTTEGADVPDLSLPLGQDALISAVGAANPNTVVVLETGGPVLMPWLDTVGAVVEAWYPGAQGGEAIAAILFGDVNPAGRLPITFPRSVDQLPRPELPGLGERWTGPGGPAIDLSTAPGLDVPHEEGSDVGYRWFARQQRSALFPFGFGLSYTRFEYSGLEITVGEAPSVRFTIMNTGARAGLDTPQVYLRSRRGQPTTRLLGWAQARLEPGESRAVTVPVEPRLLADFDVAGNVWRIREGEHELTISRSAEEDVLRGTWNVAAAHFNA